MNEFLQYLENIYRKNNLEDYQVIYSMLVHNNIAGEDIETYFKGWIDNYSNQSDKILVFQADNWKYFCQFIHPYSQSCDSKKMIKLYLSFEAKYMYKAVQIIFDYLNKNDIIHRSKVSSNTRNDAIVIRVNNLFDARKIIDFVNHNFFLKRHLIPSNPLVYKEHGVGMAIDGGKSYNSELARLLFKYFEYRKKQRINTQPSVGELRNFISNIYNNIQDNYVRNIYKLIAFNLDGTLDNDKFTDLVNDYQNSEIILLTSMKSLLLKKGQEYTVFAIKQALKGDCSYLCDTEISYDLKVCLSPSSIKRIIINKLGCTDSIGTKEMMTFVSYVSNTFVYNGDDKIKVLIIALQETMKKQGRDINANNLASMLLFEFIGKKDYNVITRENNLRNFIRVALTPNEIDEILPFLKRKYQGFDGSDYRLLMIFIENEVLNNKRKK